MGSIACYVWIKLSTCKCTYIHIGYKTNEYFILHHKACNGCVYEEGQYDREVTDKKYQTSYSHWY